MVKKIFIAFFILSIAYSVFVQIINPQKWSFLQDEGNKNTYKGENFIFDSQKKYDKIIVGSSLADRIGSDSLPETINLAFGGQSIYDGFFILKAKKEYPRFLLIETNWVTRPESLGFISQFSNPVFLVLKRNIAALREDKKPLSALAEGMKELIHQVVLIKNKDQLPESAKNINPSQQINAPQKQISKNANRMNWVIDLRREELSKVPSKRDMDNIFTKLKKDVTFFEKQGCKIIFFEMPINYNLESTPLPVEVRKDFLKYFPKKEYKYIEMPENTKFETSDGMHLGVSEVQIYKKFMRNKIDSITSLSNKRL